MFPPLTHFSASIFDAQLLQFLYEGKVSIELSNVVFLLAQAEYYGVDELTKQVHLALTCHSHCVFLTIHQCHLFVKQKIKRKTVLHLLKDAIQADHTEMVERSVTLSLLSSS